MKTRPLTIPLFLAYLLVCAGGASAMSVTRSVFATDITGREPEGVAVQFSPFVGKVVYFNQINDVKAPATLKHVWKHDDKVELEVELPVEEEGWRIWSVKKIRSIELGKWYVEVMDESGNVLESASFIVGW